MTRLAISRGRSHKFTKVLNMTYFAKQSPQITNENQIIRHYRKNNLQKCFRKGGRVTISLELITKVLGIYNLLTI